MYQRVGSKLTLVGAGGVGSGADAYVKLRAGATLVQLYSALAYEGPGLVARIKRELLDCLARDGFARVSDAIGAGP
jgi:dihydroorotate dehydrogenase